jgi:hypothetical protein
MKISEFAAPFTENFPDIATSIIKLTEDESLQKTLSQAGTIGGLINLGIAIFNKLRDKLQTEEQKDFVSFIRVAFESSKESVPSDIIDLSSSEVRSEIEIKEILNLFSSNYSLYYYHLPDHPAIKKFRDDIIAVMKENVQNVTNREIQSFIVNFNSTIINNAKKSTSLEKLLQHWQLKSTNDLIIRYLEYLTCLLDETNAIDNRPISEYYIENILVEIDKESWEVPSGNLYRFDPKPWKIENFIESDKNREFIGAEFGTGKTNFAKQIAVIYATKYLSGKDTYIPIYVPLKRNLNNVYGDYSLQDIIAMIGDQKILLICDALDEYASDPYTLIYELIPQKFTSKALKTIFTTRLEPDLPKKIDISSNNYVRLLPFTTEQVDEFFSRSKYNLPAVTSKTLIEFGLDETEILKPLFCWMFAVMYNSPSSYLNIPEISDQNLKRALFFQEVIHSIIEGKHKDSINGKDITSLYREEKVLLRNLAYLYSVYRDNLTTSADLTDSTIELNSKFRGTNFSEANLSKVKSRTNDDSLFSAEFIGCDFGDTKFINAKINDYNFKGCDFHNADFSDAELHSNFLDCNLSSVKTTQKTNTKHLTLCGASYSDAYLASISPKKKQLINITLQDIDLKLKQIIIRDNPGFP